MDAVPVKGTPSTAEETTPLVRSLRTAAITALSSEKGSQTVYSLRAIATR